MIAVLTTDPEKAFLWGAVLLVFNQWCAGSLKRISDFLVPVVFKDKGDAEGFVLKNRKAIHAILREGMETASSVEEQCLKGLGGRVRVGVLCFGAFHKTVLLTS